MSKGYVYILANKFIPDLIKIGRTAGDPETRAAQLFTTGVPGPFEVLHKIWTPNCDDLESYLHEVFACDRIAENREFFKSAASEVANAAYGYLGAQVKRILIEFMPGTEIVPGWTVMSEGRLDDLEQETGYGRKEILLSMLFISADELKALRPRYEKAAREAENISEPDAPHLKVVGEE